MSEQMSLFGDLTQRLNQYGMPLQDAPIARASDPEPSHVAADQVSSGLSDIKVAFVLTLQQSNTGMTASEVAAAAIPIEPGQAAVSMCRRETMRKRASELVRSGWIRVIGQRACGITGKLATVYEVAK